VSSAPCVDGDTIRIRRSLYRAGAERGAKAPKGKRERWVTVGPVAGALLEDWRRKCVEKAAAACINLVPDDFVVSAMPDGSRPINPPSHQSCTSCAPSSGCPTCTSTACGTTPPRSSSGRASIPGPPPSCSGTSTPALTLRVYTLATAERQPAGGWRGAGPGTQFFDACARKAPIQPYPTRSNS
jgi:hypothetical protein